MYYKFILTVFLALQISLSVSSQTTLSTTTANNGSGGVFLRLTANSSPVIVQTISTYFSSTSGTAVNVEVYSRDGDYAGFTSSVAGWTLLGTASTVSAGTATLAAIDVAPFNLQIAASSAKSIYLHATTTGGGIRYTGTAAAPPVTTWSDANLTLFSDVARTGIVAFAGTQFNPRTFAGSIQYVLGLLPVKWVNVSAANERGQALINWEVEEANVKSYQVEKQTDNSYKTVATVNSRGNGRNSYSVNDATAFSPEKNMAFYRVKQTDLDGRVTYSNVVVVKKSNATTGINVYPNPCINSVTITLTSSQSATVYNNAGHALRVLPLKNGTNAIDTRDWLPGIYLLKTKTGETVRIIRQ